MFYVRDRITANQGFYLLGLDNTTPTFASAIQNSVPAITFLMAAILRHVHTCSFSFDHFPLGFKILNMHKGS